MASLRTLAVLLLALVLCTAPALASKRMRYNEKKEDYKCGRGREFTRSFVRENTDLSITGDGCTETGKNRVRCVYRFEGLGDTNTILDLKCTRKGWKLTGGLIPTSE